MAGTVPRRTLEIFTLAECRGCDTAWDLAALLLREADAYGTVAGRGHQDLAERLGTDRETVSQTFGRFRAEGLVAVEPRRIRLLDPDGLQAYAEG